MPPDDISSTSGFIISDEQAKQTWNDWSPWTVTEDVFELTTESQVDAFLEIAEKNKLWRKKGILKIMIQRYKYYKIMIL